MDIYHAWCDLKPGVSDIVFSEQVAAYLGHLKADGQIEGWRLIPGARNDESSIISGAWYRARGCQWESACGRAPNQDSIPTARHRPIGQRLGPLV
jgi:hypothetical protein